MTRGMTANVGSKATAAHIAVIDASIDNAQRHLLAHQYSDGYWWGELESIQQVSK